nr:unnamed protein product [Callosobruchus analis]
MLPDTLPDNAEVWYQYRQQPSYKQLAKDYQENERFILENHNEYWKMLKKLVRLRENVEAMKTEIQESSVVIEATIAANLDSPSEKTEQTFIETNQDRQKDLQMVVRELKQYQEGVLQLQTGLKIHMRHRNSLKRAIIEDFHNYSTMKYTIPMICDMNLIDGELKKLMKDRKDIFLNFAKVTDTTDDLESVVEQYKKLQAMEMERYNKLRASKKHTWKIK